MAVEDIDITLENLLNLSLGNPEIGAVNFNFLHEVIHEILKHLGKNCSICVHHKRKVKNG